MKKLSFILLSCIFAFVITINYPVLADNESENLKFFSNSFADKLIENLFDKRIEMLNNNEFDKIRTLDKELKKYGVEKINIKNMHKKDVVMKMIPFVDVPISNNNVEFFSFRKNVRKGTKTYEIQTIIAQPRGTNTSLYHYKGYVNYLPSNKIKKIVNVLFIKAVDEALSYRYTWKYKLTTLLLEMFNSTKDSDNIRQIQSLCEIKNATTVNFKFVKEKGKSDAYQKLTFVSTKCHLVVEHQYNADVIKGTIRPKKVFLTTQNHIRPKLYDNNNAAIEGFQSPAYKPRTDYVKYIEVSVFENNKYTIYPPMPLGLGHIF